MKILGVLRPDPNSGWVWEQEFKETMGTCIFVKAWIGYCGKQCQGDYCEEHLKEKCSSCGEQANRTCSHTHGLVCGAPLCPNCKDVTFMEGGSYKHRHVKK